MVDSTPFFSVIIPAYNRPQPLHTCLQSLAALNYPRDSYEVVVVDDGSPTPLAGVVESFADSMAVRLVRQPNRGAAAARNHGAQAANGDYLAFTDDDCAPHADWLKAFAVAIAERGDDAAGTLFGGGIKNRLLTNPYARATQFITDMVYAHYNREPHNARFFACMNLAFPRETYLKMGGFDEQFYRLASEDREICNRWLHAGLKLVYVPDALIYHAHDLTFKGYCRQHFSYGGGAYYYHRRRAERGSGHITDEMGFHTNWRNWRDSLLRYRREHDNLPQLILLLFVWQFINAAGFFYQALKRLFSAQETT